MSTTDTFTDLPLFRSLPAQRHSDTSTAAAASLKPKQLTTLHRLVLGFLIGKPQGLTDEEIAVGLQLNPSTQRPRRVELARRGLVVRVGKRKTRSGRQAATWALTRKNTKPGREA